MRVNKYLYLWVLQGDYGQGWDDLTAEENWKEIIARKREYLANDTYARDFRIIRRREPNPEYKAVTVA